MANSINIELTVDVLTSEAVGDLVTSLLELLLYQRNQIPFVFKIFKYMISNWKKNDDDSEEIVNFQEEREKMLAQQTLQNIKEMSRTIRKALHKGDVSCVRFLFGATAITPREVYTINLPRIARGHIYEHHHLSSSNLNQALISILSNECFYSIFSTSLCPTNVFANLEMPDSDADDLDQMNSIDTFDFPPSCQKFEINVVHTLPLEFVDMKCCKELTVFQEISNLSLSSDGNSGECESNEERLTGWWQTSMFVKGYKQKIIKGSNLWQ